MFSHQNQQFLFVHSVTNSNKVTLSVPIDAPPMYFRTTDHR